MTNEDYEQWLPLVKKVAWKFRNNKYKIELEDLEQIASIGLMRGFDSFEDGKDASMQTHLYNCIKWQIIREFDNYKRIKRQIDYNTTSLDKPIGENEDMILEDIIKDETIDIEASILDKMIEEAYKKEVAICLSGREKEIVNKYLFYNMNLTEIGKIYDMPHTKVGCIVNRGFRNLKHKSKMIREKWLELKERDLEKNIISAYNNPEKVFFRIETTERLALKYKKEIELLNFLQSVFDDLIYNKSRKYRDFIAYGMPNILNPKDIFIYKELYLDKNDKRELIKQGYSFDEIWNVERSIKKQIILNKENVYKLWQNFSVGGEYEKKRL